LTSKLRHVENLVIEILTVMIGINKYALTCDHWTSIAGSTFLAVTCHFINENWEIISLTLTCSEHRGRTTAAQSKKAIEEVLKKYDLKLENAVALVTDTENTMSALGKLIDGDHHYCAADVLELTTVSFYY
jgi:zinc finger BED domain-containing protein 1 (E3 SUMO-protein ligase ZBED1)